MLHGKVFQMFGNKSNLMTDWNMRKRSDFISLITCLALKIESMLLKQREETIRRSPLC